MRFAKGNTSWGSQGTCQSVQAHCVINKLRPALILNSIKTNKNWLCMLHISESFPFYDIMLCENINIMVKSTEIPLDNTIL